jgi:hypothetical protein
MCLCGSRKFFCDIVSLCIMKCGYPTFLTSELDGGEWLASRPSRFTPEYRTPVSIAYEDWRASEPVWALWRTEKSYPARNRTLIVQPVA